MGIWKSNPIRPNRRNPRPCDMYLREEKRGICVCVFVILNVTHAIQVELQNVVLNWKTIGWVNMGKLATLLKAQTPNIVWALHHMCTWTKLKFMTPPHPNKKRKNKTFFKSIIYKQILCQCTCKFPNAIDIIIWGSAWLIVWSKYVRWWCTHGQDQNHQYKWA